MARALMLMLFLTPTISQAQTVAPSPESPESIVVSGSRLPQPKIASGSALTLIDATQLEALQTPIVSDILRTVPGVGVSRSGGVGALTQVRIRGSEANHTVVIADGIKLNDPATGNDLRFEELLTSGLARLEVLRGSASSIYGAEAIGGVISLVTLPPVNGVQAQTLVEGGSFATLRGVVGVRAGGESAGFAAHVSGLRTNGINTALQGDERDGAQNLTAHLTGHVNPSEASELGVVLRYVGSETEFDPAPTQPRDGALETFSRKFFSRAYGRIDLFEGLLRQEVSAGFTRTRTRNLSKDDPEDGFDNNRVRAKRFTLSSLSRLAYDFNEARTELIGAVDYEELRFTSLSDDPAVGQGSFGIDQRRKRERTSFTLEARVSLFERLFVAGSVRHDQNSVFKDATTLRGNISFAAAPTLTLRASVGEGVADPTFTELFGFFPNSFVGNPNLTPERALSGDIGVDYAPIPGLRLSATYYKARLTDEIITVFNPNFTSSVANASGKSKRQGVELEAGYAVSDRFLINAQYSFTDADEQRTRDSAQSTELRRPRHSASLSATATLLAGLRTTALVSYTGAQTDTEFLSRAPFSRRVRLDDYVLLSASVDYQATSRLNLFARVENISDSRQTDVVGFNSPGIAVSAGVRFLLGDAPKAR
jgi:vitamin B12 transporter